MTTRMQLLRTLQLFLFAWCSRCSSFSPDRAPLRSRDPPILRPNLHPRGRVVPIALSERTDEGNAENPASVDSTSIWMPQLRRIMAGVASLGAIETSYLVYNKLYMDEPPFCGLDGNCNEVLTGPYSVVPFTGIPIAAVGLVAYLSVVVLALAPLSNERRNGDMADAIINSDDTQNRILLTSLTTTMGTFSIFLMAILFGVLQTNCPYCVFSAACSIVLAKTAWIGGCLPESSKSSLGGEVAASGFAIATLSAVLLFASGQVEDFSSSFSSKTFLAGSTNSVPTLVASTGSSASTTKLYSPPDVTADSSERAMNLAKTLKSLDAKMYGAYWCSHCYDQKQILGKQAFSQFVEYVECSKEGVNSQNQLCKAKEVPGYPTWEIQGIFYPGEQELDELEDLVKSLPAAAAGR